MNTPAISAACAAGQEPSRHKLLSSQATVAPIVSACGWMPRTPKERKRQPAPAQEHFAESFGIADTKTYRWSGSDFQPNRRYLTKR
jgi:hypothetical protein